MLRLLSAPDEGAGGSGTCEEEPDEPTEGGRGHSSLYCFSPAYFHFFFTIGIFARPTPPLFRHKSIF